MASRAALFPTVGSAESNPADQILGLSHGLEVFRVAALAVPAQVVDHFAFGDGPDVLFVHEAMGEVVALLVVVKLPIAGWGNVPDPFPAAVLGVSVDVSFGSDVIWCSLASLDWFHTIHFTVWLPFYRSKSVL